LPANWSLNGGQALFELLWPTGTSNRTSAPASPEPPGPTASKSHLPMPTPAVRTRGSPASAPAASSSAESSRGNLRDEPGGTPASAGTPASVGSPPSAPTPSPSSGAPLTTAEMNHRAKQRMALKRQELARPMLEAANQRRNADWEKLKNK